MPGVNARAAPAIPAADIIESATVLSHNRGMKINFFATLRQITGQKTVEFDLPEGLTAREVLDAVVARYPAMQRELLDENGDLHRHCHMFINGRGVPFLLDKMETVIKPGDTVNIFPAVGGG